MEYVFPNLLSAEDLRRVLSQRNLIIPNIEQLNYNELLDIFKKFAVPMNRRCGRRQGDSPPNDLQPKEVPMPVPNTAHKRILPPPINDCASKLSRVSINNHVNGSRQSINNHVNGSRLSINNHVNGQPQMKRQIEELDTSIVHTTPSKRKKITWP